MHRLLLSAVLAVSLLVPGAAFAKAHHTPMAVPIDCHGDFACLHPGYVVTAADRDTITTWWGGSKLITVCVCNGRSCFSQQQG